MKKVKFTGKLSLNKETVAKLNNEQLLNVNGGKCTLQNSGCSSASGSNATNSPSVIDCCL